MPEHSDYQKKVIQRYYENRDQLDEQRLAELATDLYLAEGKKRAKLWEDAEELMRRLKVPESRIAHVVKSDDPVAHNTHTYTLRSDPVNIIIPPNDREGVPVRKPNPELLPMPVKCDIHPWMAAHWLIVDHP
jgi:hypothetical protein